MKRLICFASAVCLALSSVASAETGDLKIRFEYGGAAPTPGLVPITKDVEFCGKHKLTDERLLVNPKNKGIKNVVVYVYTGRGGSDLGDIAPANKTHVLANENCRFEPRVVIAQKGDTLKITNPDDVGHNANLILFNNKAQNLTVAAGQDVSVELKKDEPGLMSVECNIHPWMKAFLVVQDHPFAAVTDENGDVTIKGLPTGKLVFRVNHEAGSIREVKINGEDTEWSRSRFEVDIKPGVNDLGTVVIPADALKAE